MGLPENRRSLKRARLIAPAECGTGESSPRWREHVLTFPQSQGFRSFNERTFIHELSDRLHRRRHRRRTPAGRQCRNLKWLGPNFPWGTLCVNILGSLVMGLIAEYWALKSGLPQSARLFLTTGILGGFTTFSTFSLDTATIFERGETWLATAMPSPPSFFRWARFFSVWRLSAIWSPFRVDCRSTNGLSASARVRARHFAGNGLFVLEDGLAIAHKIAGLHRLGRDTPRLLRLDSKADFAKLEEAHDLVFRNTVA